MEFHHLSKIVENFPNTAVSRFACFQIRKKLADDGLAFDDEIVGSLLLCRKCSQKLMPGVNCEVSIEKGKKNLKNCAVYFCLFCKNKTRFRGIKKGPCKYDSKKKNKKIEDHPELKKEKIEKKVEETIKFVTPVMRTLNKIETKKSLLETFFESAEKNNLYKIFH